MATTTGKRSDLARREIAERMERLTLWKLRDMRRTWHRPRTLRLGKEARVLKSLIREAQAVGLMPPEPAPPPRRRRLNASPPRTPAIEAACAGYSR